MKPFLRTDKMKIVCNGTPVRLRGVNVGGWLMMEGYFMHAPNLGERVFKENFVKTLGADALTDFEKSFRDNFVAEKDFRRIAQWGFNCIRVPFHHRLVESEPYRYNAGGVKYLDDVVRWAEKYRLWVILDLHAVPGAQNHDWHSDSLGTAELWQGKDFQDRTVALWEFLSDRYKDCPAVAGYDLMNESVVDDARLLNAFYARLITAIRGKDKNHILFVEGNKWATDIACLKPVADDNWALSVHYYEPVYFTFNLIPHLSYPFRKPPRFSVTPPGTFNKTLIGKIMKNHLKIARRHGVPVFVGEFGVNYRQGFYGEDVWVKDTISCFEECGFHWTYWTYKAIKNAVFPDGLFSFTDNPPWVGRQGPRQGWDNFSACWPQRRGEMIASWGTDRFEENSRVIDVLHSFVKGTS